MQEDTNKSVVLLCDHMLQCLRRLEIQLRSDDYNDVRAIHNFISAMKQAAEQGQAQQGESNEASE